jgi:tetratricopeptide (TPR) repeat protein
MEKKKDFCCTLLKLERIRQNKGQKEVCYGICVPSYLSKIEHNQVTPDKAILKQLFHRLGIEFYSEEEFIKRNGELIGQYFEQLFYGLDRSSYRELKQEDERLTYSPLALDWLLVKGCEDDPDAAGQLARCTEHMDSLQLAYFYLLQPLNKKSAEQVIPLYHQAYRILNNSFSLLLLMQAYFLAGQYDKVHECSDKCISLALEEGNTCNLAGCYQMIGTAYACLNAEDLMLPFYKRAIHLLQNTNWKDQLNDIYYNIGATLISSRKYEESLRYLDMVQKEDSFLLNHKKALVLIRSKRQTEAAQYINRMEAWLQEKQGDASYTVEKLMYEEAVFECREDFLGKPEYIELLEKLMEQLMLERHKGYVIFYRDILQEAYCRQRKYKKALELSLRIS